MMTTRTLSSYPGSSQFERNMKYVHASWLVLAAAVAFVSLALYAESGISWHLPLALPVAILAGGYGAWLFVGHIRVLARRRAAWAGGLPCRGEIVAIAPSSFGNFAYYRVGVRARVGGREHTFEDRFIYPHVAERLSVGQPIEMRCRPDAPEIFALDMRL